MSKSDHDTCKQASHTIPATSIASVSVTVPRFVRIIRISSLARHLLPADFYLGDYSSQSLISDIIPLAPSIVPNALGTLIAERPPHLIQRHRSRWRTASGAWCGQRSHAGHKSCPSPAESLLVWWCRILGERRGRDYLFQISGLPELIEPRTSKPARLVLCVAQRSPERPE